MDRLAGALLLGAALAAPLFEIPGTGFDALRRPLVLALLAGALGAAAWGRARGLPASADRDPLGSVAGLLLAAALLSLAFTGPRADTLPVLMTLAAAVAAYACARHAPLPEGFAAGPAPALLAGTAALAGLWAALQAFDGRPAVAGEGNVNYAAALAGILLAPSLGAHRGTRFRLLGAAGVAGALALLALSGSRGGWIGALAGMGVYAAVSRRCLATAILAAVVILLPFVARGKEAAWAAERLETGRVRLGLWKGAAALFQERPLLGFGPGGFGDEYPRHRDPEEFAISQRHVPPGALTRAEDAHSLWVQAAADTGLLGLLAWLLVPWTAGRRFVAHARAAPESAELLGGYAGGAAAFLVAGAFNTLSQHLSPMLLAWALLGLGDRLGMQVRRVRQRRGGSASIAAWSTGAALLGLAVLPALGLLEQDLIWHRAMRETDPAARAAVLARLPGNLPGIGRLRAERGRVLERLGRPTEALEDLRAALEERPHAADVWNNLGTALLASRGSESEAKAAFERAEALAPAWAPPVYHLGVLLMLRHELPSAEAALARACALDPAHAKARFSLGEVLWRSGRKGPAKEAFRAARALGLEVGSVLDAEHPDWRRDPELEEFFRP